MRTVSTKLDKKDHELLLEICNSEGQTVSEALRDMIQSHCNSFEEETEIELDENNSSEIPKPTLTKVREPIKLTCKNGELWTQWTKVDSRSIPTRTKYGDCTDFELINGNVYNKSGELIGIIENQD